MTRRSIPWRQVVAVAAIAGLFAAVTVFGELAAQRPDCCAGKPTVASMYSKRNSGIDRLLVTGDAQAFAAVAQDPLLQRPEVFGSATELSYRAQRPLWAYAAWAASLGQPQFVGWALLALAIVACVAAAGAGALLSVTRGASAWWGLAVVVIGLESLTELTPELAAFALFAAGLLLWTRDRRGLAVAALCLSVLTRETMLVGVAALALWELVGPNRTTPRRVAPLAWPLATYGAWAVALRARTGHFPFEATSGRSGLPGRGLLTALSGASDSSTILLGAVLAAAVCIAALVLARRDVLTWVATAYLLFASTLGPLVWTVHMAFTRVLLPLYACGLIAVVGALHARNVTTRHDAAERALEVAA